MTRPAPSLYLLTPVLGDPAAFAAALEAACAVGEVTAVLLRLAPADERTLVNRVKLLAGIAQAYEVAVIVDDPGGTLDLATLVSRGGADGGQANDPGRLEALCLAMDEGRNIGAGSLRSKHDAMTAGERGVDYVMFGEPRPDGTCPPLDATVERASWWAEIFQTPCVVYADSLADVPTLAATGAEFVALGRAVWDDPDGPAAAVATARLALGEVAPA